MLRLWFNFDHFSAAFFLWFCRSGSRPPRTRSAVTGVRGAHLTGAAPEISPRSAGNKSTVTSTGTALTKPPRPTRPPVTHARWALLTGAGASTRPKRAVQWCTARRSGITRSTRPPNREEPSNPDLSAVFFWSNTAFSQMYCFFFAIFVNRSISFWQLVRLGFFPKGLTALQN